HLVAVESFDGGTDRDLVRPYGVDEAVVDRRSASNLDGGRDAMRGSVDSVGAEVTPQRPLQEETDAVGESVRREGAHPGQDRGGYTEDFAAKNVGRRSQGDVDALGGGVSELRGDFAAAVPGADHENMPPDERNRVAIGDRMDHR